MDLGDFLILFFIFLTIVVFLQLRSVLGKRTGHENHFLGFFVSHKKISLSSSKDDKWSVVSLEKENKQSVFDYIDVIFPFGTKLNQSLRDIVSVYPSFNPKGFLSVVRDVYEIIVVAFFEGNIKEIRTLVDNKVYEDFSKSILSKKCDDDKTVKSSLVGIDDVKIIDASIDKNLIYIKTRIVGQYISVSYNKDNMLIPGEPEIFGKVIDVWTFVRDITSSDPNWKLLSTESGS